MTPTEQTFVDVVAREMISRSGSSPTMAGYHGYMLAAKLLGMIEERNGASIEEIERAAAKADCGVDPSKLCIDHDDACTLDDPSAFFRAIARESLGEGKVFDEYESFQLEHSHCPYCAAPRFDFSVPRLNIEGARS